MKNKIYPSISMLPMEDIAKYLNLVHGFRKKNEVAPDTEAVAGIESDIIAICATDEHGVAIDGRKTVENALKLGNRPAADFLTIDKSDSLLTDTYSVSYINAEEIQAIRDELYQLKGELAKNGYINNSYSYFGFQEAFKNGDVKFIDNTITRTISTENNIRVNQVTVEDTSELYPDEYIIIANGGVEAGKQYVTKIDEILPDGTIRFSPEVPGPIMSKSEIRKTLGMYHEGSFIFAKEDDNEPKVNPDKKKYVILNDDFNEYQLDPIANDKSGYIMTFRVPKRTPGAITKLSVQASVINSPGSLIAHIANINTEADEKKLLEAKTFDEIKALNIIKGTSKPIPFSAASRANTEITFDFDESKGVPVNTSEKYAVIITVANAGEVDVRNNYWSLLGVRGNGENGDLHTAINLHRFDEHMGSTQKVGVDLWFALTINEVFNEKIIYTNEGLYSTHVALPYNEYATRARVELKINREGLFNVTPNPNKLIVGADKPVELVNKDNKEYTSSIFTAGTPMVIGNQITKVGETRHSNTYFTLGETTYAPANADAYRVGYKVNIKARKMKIDYSNETNPIVEDKTVTPVVFEVPFSAVIPGKENGRKSSSDRLIFERSIATKFDSHILEKYNDFVVQVYWRSQGVTEREMYDSPELAGQIFDVTVALDKSYSNKENI